VDVKEFTFRLAVLFFPGLIGFLIYDRLTVRKKVEIFFFVLNSFVFGALAYFWTWVASLKLFPFLNAQLVILNSHWHVLGHSTAVNLRLPTKLTLWDELQTPNGHIDLNEIGWTTVIAVLMSLVFAFVSNRKIHYRFARFLRITKKSGEVDVWGFVMNSSGDTMTWITLRDTDTDLSYDGWIHSFSEDQITTELFLRDVSVYRNSTSDFLYQVGAMYFKIDPKKVILEFRAVPVTETHKTKEATNNEQEQSTATGGTNQRGIDKEGRGEHDPNKSTSATPAAAATNETGHNRKEMM